MHSVYNIMKLKDFINKLEDFEFINQDLEVHIADWNEQYAPANADVAGKMHIKDGALIIGDDGERP